MLCLNISDVAIIIVKGVDYCCIIYDISRFQAIHLENYVLKDRGYISKLHIQEINIKNQVNNYCFDNSVKA